MREAAKDAIVEAHKLCGRPRWEWAPRSTPCLFRGTTEAMAVRKVHPVLQKIEEDLRQVVEGLGYEYVMAKLSGPSQRPRLAVYVDRPGGVTLDDCQRISERLSVLLDMLDPIPGSYELIVSSPGLDRPLVREGDFVRFSGRLASIRRTTVDGKRETVQGRLLGLEAGAVILERDGRTEAVPLDDIEEAHVVYEWES